MRAPIAAPKQLKKNDFLTAVTEAPMTKGELVDALEEYEFIDSYLDFLIDHFKAQGKVIVTEGEIAGTITIQRKGKKTGGPRTVFRVVGFVAQDENDEDVSGYELESKEITGNLSDEDKDAGFSMTEKAAVKKASSDVFAQYKANTAAIKALLEADETAEDKAE